MMTTAQAAEQLGVHIGTVREWIRTGKLPATRLGYRTVRIRREDLDAFTRKPFSKETKHDRPA